MNQRQDFADNNLTGFSPHHCLVASAETSLNFLMFLGIYDEIKFNGIFNLVCINNIIILSYTQCIA